MSRFVPVLGECEHLVVVDNTPGRFAFGPLPAQVQVLQDGINRGLGPALNRGILAAREAGADYVVLFDQDSTPASDTVGHLLEVCRAGQAQWGERCAVGPTHVDDGTGSRIEARRRGHIASQPYEVTCLPTSGLLFPVQAVRADALFASDLFLDLVDFEWCWRQRREGWRFLRTPGTCLRHRFGIEERRCLGLRFYVPAPYRHYFQFRDALRLASRGYVPLYSRVRLACLLPVKLLLYPLILDQGIERLRWMVRGVVDAFRGITGLGAASTRLAR